jgi:hypothetical protein
VSQITLVPNHWYLVTLKRDGEELTTVLRFAGVEEETDRLIFEGYEEPGLATDVRVVRELKEG